MIVPSIDVMGGRAVQLVRGKTLEIDAGDPRPIAERFALAGEVAVIDLDAALGRGDNRALIRELLAIAPCRVGGGIRDAATAFEWLNAGARKVILGTAARPEVLERLPRDRVIAALDAVEGEVVVEGWTKRTGRDVASRMRELRELVGGFLVTFVEVEGTLGGLPLERASALVESAGSARVTFAGGVRRPEELAALDALGADGQVGMALYSGRMDLAAAITAPLRSDREDGLWPTVVEDVSGRTLGLVWSDEESVRTALEERRGVYRSRSRGLWRKGETSGATQELVRISLDCDRDALRFIVRQAGAGFCHTGAASCFDADGGSGFAFSDLEDRLRERLSGVESTGENSDSLTVRLAREPGLLTGKLVEEAAELAAARSADEAVAEFCDLFYFALTRLLEAGGSLERARSELGRRASRTRARPPREPGADRDSAHSAGERLPLRTADEVARLVRRRSREDGATEIAVGIVEDVRTRGAVAVRAHAERLGELGPDDPIVLSRGALDAALERLDASDRGVLERTADRIRRFAEAQLASAGELDVQVPGGRAGHSLLPVRAAGCYVPGGRFPLPSSALMTVIPARVAGVEHVWVASPRPTAHTLAAAAIAGADGLLAVGGAQGVAALAFGLDAAPAADVVVGPGNRFVTAAKRHVFGDVGIDMLAGPSELLVVVRGSFSPADVAADLIAQAEHDPAALPLASVESPEAAEAVREAVRVQLEDLPTRETAEVALARGGIVVVADEDRIVELVETVRPEHLHLAGSHGARLLGRLRAYGAVFLGEATSEVMGDYGAGPNHTLPTGGTAGFAEGLSVFSFLRRPTWLELSDTAGGYGRLVRDVVALARMEGLEGHARAAERRIPAVSEGAVGR